MSWKSKEYKMTEEISMKNTKKEMLAAIKEMQQRMEESKKTTLEPQKEKVEKQNMETIEVADKITQTDLTSQIHKLKLEINNELSKVSDVLENEAKQYNKLKDAIQIKKTEFQEIYGIEKETINLAVILETQKSVKNNFENQFAIDKKMLEDEITEKRFLWTKEKEENKKITQEEKATIEKERKREDEEYNYKLQRKREIESNAYADKIKMTEKELAEQKEIFDKKVSEKENELSDRETNITVREKQIDELQNKVDQFPSILEKEVEKAIDQAEKSITNSFTHEKAILEKEFEGERNVYKTKISALESQVKDQSKQLEKLSLQQEKAYEQVKDIANRAVSSAGEKANRGNEFYTRQEKE